MDQCPECGASWAGGMTCREAFDQLLYWEAEFPALGVVHHLMVLCYHLQHPGLYSPDGVKYAVGLLHEFVEEGISTEESRRRSRDKVDSGKRQWKVAAHETPGSYAAPVIWQMTALDVVAGGADHYIERTKAWAAATNTALRGIGM